ncbi:MAG: DUF4215 domain-containing protein [Nanoarchaeota archaeon]|nr:DUF4215 domain-containing protein [Nanoarchaeota archaeon]
MIVDPTSTSLPSGEFLETDENNNEKTKSVTICGNNIKEIGERCDDGNNVDGDGCSSTCTVETATT